MGVTLTPVNFDPFATSKSHVTVANSLASLGRNGDRILQHSTPGDVTITAEKMADPDIAAKVQAILGDQLDRFTAGSNANSINPITGLIEMEDGDGSGEGSGNGGENGSGGTAGPGGVSSGGTTSGEEDGDTAADTTTTSVTQSKSETAVESSLGISDNAPNANTSATAAEEAVNPGVNQSDLSIGNLIGNKAQSILSDFSFDPLGFLGAIAINGILGALPVVGPAISAINLGLAVTGHQSIGKDAIGLGKDAIGSASSTGATTDSNSGATSGDGSSSDLSATLDPASTIQQMNANASQTGSSSGSALDFPGSNSSLASSVLSGGGSVSNFGAEGDDDELRKLLLEQQKQSQQQEDTQAQQKAARGGK